MNEKTRESIQAHVERIIQEFRFNKRRITHQDECPCYKSTPCYDIEELNCFLCYCPEYNTESIEGGCKISSKEGKWFYHPSHPTGRIWDCTNCSYPNKEKTVRVYLEKLFGLKE